MKPIDCDELRRLYAANTKVVDIAMHFGVCVATIHDRLRRLKLRRAPIAKHEDITGKSFGQLTAVKFVRLDKFGKALWLMRCSCGNEKVLNASAAKAGLTQSCGCYKRTRLRKGIGDLSQAYWHKLEKSALSRDLAFDITKQQMWELFLQQGKVCALTGVPIVLWPNNDSYRRQTASLDRIDSTRGYVQGNVQWVHKRVQFLKRDYSEQELVYWSCKIADKQRGRFVDITTDIPREIRRLRAAAGIQQEE